MVEVTTGNLFTTSHQTLVNTVNCVSVMGAGIALECRLRYPAMFEKYRELCDSGQLHPGVLWLYKGGESSTDVDSRWILNFPTKDNWKFPSRLEYLVSGLDKFLETYRQEGITSIAFPVLGGLNGGLDPDLVIQLMSDKLTACDIPITIYRYSETAADDLFDKFKAAFTKTDIASVSRDTHVRRDILEKVRDAIVSPNIHQMNQLARVPGIGAKTLEALFRYVSKADQHWTQEELF